MTQVDPVNRMTAHVTGYVCQGQHGRKTVPCLDQLGRYLRILSSQTPTQKKLVLSNLSLKVRVLLRKDMRDEMTVSSIPKSNCLI